MYTGGTFTTHFFTDANRKTQLSPSIVIALDYMEYSSDANAQAAYVTDGGYVSQYPTQDADHVKATTTFGTDYPYLATNPALATYGVIWTTNTWLSNSVPTNQRFHIDLGSAKVVKNIYYENAHNQGLNTATGVKNFTLWGSNSATAFAELTYGTDTDWTQLTTSQSTFDQHVASDEADPKYITVTNTTAYRYYAFKFADNWTHPTVMGLTRVELQVDTLQSYSESTIKTQGSYSLKGVALITSSLNKTLTSTIGSPIDLSNQKKIKFDIYSSRTGANIKIGIHDSGGTTTEETYTVASANTWETVTWDISAVSNANKDAIDKIIVTVVNADANNTFYIDNMFSLSK